MKLFYPLLISILIFSCSNTTPSYNLVKNISQEHDFATGYDSTRISNELKNQINRIKRFNSISKNQYSENIALFIDMKIPSNYFRFFVVNLKTDSIVSRGLCAHGSGSNTNTADSLQFSNTPNSFMTSLGIYKIGTSYIGNFGKSYKLHGLEATNSNAFKRIVVLHPYSCVPDEEQYLPICNSLGCPMLSNMYMEEVITSLSKETKPVLMVIYY